MPGSPPPPDTLQGLGWHKTKIWTLLKEKSVGWSQCSMKVSWLWPIVSHATFSASKTRAHTTTWLANWSARLICRYVEETLTCNRGTAENDTSCPEWRRFFTQTVVENVPVDQQLLSLSVRSSIRTVDF